MGNAGVVLVLVLFFFLILSISANIVLVWFNRKVVSKLNLAGQVSLQFFTYITALRDHASKVITLNEFYGDKVLRNFLEHVKEIDNFLEVNKEIYSFIQPDLPDLLDNVFKGDDEEEDDEGATEQQTKETPQVSQEGKAIFYAGSRRRHY